MSHVFQMEIAGICNTRPTETTLQWGIEPEPCDWNASVLTAKL